MKTALVKAILAVGTLATFAGAQEEEQGRGVARISVIDGEVSVRRGDSGDWIAAAINAPLMTDDRLFCGPQSRAEVQFDFANMIRVGENSEVRLSELESQRYQVQVARGIVMFRVLRDSRSDVELSTPSVSVRPMKRGSYRVTVREDGASEITVRSGEVEIYTPRGAERLTAGRTMLARGTASDPEFQIVAVMGIDDWDRWNERRDQDLERTRSYQYVSTDIYGAEDLDGNGDWVDAPGYGWVWAPRVAVDWAPYRYGRWSWIDWYGWNWVSYDPWGWAPYHYGRWFNYGNRWCWWPGARHTRHYWSPAQVAFFGWGGHGGGIGIGIGFGNVGWVPLAPHETFHPWYGKRYYSGYRDRTYVDNSVHVVNNINITNVYRN
ncbi:MAG: FecR family protein, partial [Acidobacteriota bacterium]